MSTQVVAGGIVVAGLAALPMVYLALHKRNIPRMKQQVMPRFTSEAFKSEFGKIFHAFLSGNNFVLSPFVGMGKARDYLERQFPDYYRGFAYEGMAMGIAARASLFPSKGKKFEALIQQLGDGHLYQYYVGLGWWLYHRYRDRLTGYERWIDTLNPRYAPIVFDGVGFSAGLFQLSSNGDDFALYRRFDRFSHTHARVCYQGFGRCLWFLNEFNPDDAIRSISRIPEPYRADAFSGMGLAVAYSRFDNPTLALELLASIPAEAKVAYRQGVAFGWETRKRQNPAFWAQLLDTFVPEVRVLAEQHVYAVHKARLEVESGPDRHYYPGWMDATRKYFELHSHDSS